MGGVWAESCEIARKIRTGFVFEGRSECWHRQTQRIAQLQVDVGEAIDHAALPWTTARDIAYGRSRLQQRKRLADELAKRARAAEKTRHVPLSPQGRRKVARRTAAAILAELVALGPEELARCLAQLQAIQAQAIRERDRGDTGK